MIIQKVKDTIKRYNLINKNDLIIVGVSGGPDSLALLHMLNSLKKEFKLELKVAHVDHMLRPGSYKDAEFVRALSVKLKLPFSSARIDIRALAKKGSIEEIARNARLDFFFREAAKIKAKKIALGHNFDDQAETVLMRILRGAGLYGLAGILPKRKIKGYEVIRPLLETRRKEIESFLLRRNIKARIDLSNLQDLYLRNKVRNKLLPLLEKDYNKNIKEVLANLAQSAGADYDYLLGQAERSAKGVKSRIKLKELLKLHTAIQRLIIRQIISKLKGDTRRITFQHIKEIEDLILNRPIRSVVDLPKAVSVIKKKDSLAFFKTQ